MTIWMIQPRLWTVFQKWYKISKKCDGRSIQTWDEIAIPNRIVLESLLVLSQIIGAKICDKSLLLRQYL